MDLANILNDENSFDPTPKLISSPIPVLFVSFNEYNQKCFCCEDKYTETLFYSQKYCKQCLLRYLTEITDNSPYLDMCVNTMGSEHETSGDKELLVNDIQEWCENCSEVSYFKQILTRSYNYNDYSDHDNHNDIVDKVFESEKNCKFCGKLVYQEDSLYMKFKVCSNCYLISSDWIESSLTKKPIPILYLPWWDNKSSCIACDSNLKFPSDCQKYCSNCCIVYTGCRYCLTTNIIFGFTDRSQCKKCKIFITIDENVSSNDFLYNSILNLYDLQLDEIIDDVRKADNPMDIYTFIGEKHRLRNTNPTLKLKSTSPIPILFVSFNQKRNQKCFHCGNNYIKPLYYHHRYCKKCLLNYIADITNVNTQLDADACICEHGMDSNDCLECYQISSGWVESTLTKKRIPILYLPWWDNKNGCIACNSELEFTSDCQKYCTHCCIIYIGCRYCLTTNIIFGYIDQTQCRRCKRELLFTIDITSINSGNKNLNNFLHNQRLKFYNSLQLDEIISDKFNDNPIEVYNFINEKYKKTLSKPMMEWIPYSQIASIEKLAKGGFGIIYKATWLDGPLNESGERKGLHTVGIKKFTNSQDISTYFLNELRLNQYRFKFKHHVIRPYGFTKEPQSKDYMLVMQYASGGDLHNYLKKKFIDITWNDKLRILLQISKGLETIHDAGLIHRDLHSGNILFAKKHQCQIGDLGISQHANNSSDDEIFGVIPYIAPEIFRGSKFSKESDVYSFGMIMWELTSSYKPFSNVEHDHNLINQIVNGRRPGITDDTPEFFANLMKNCWNSNPNERKPIREICKIFDQWFNKNENMEEFEQAEIKRKDFCSEFTRKSHTKTIFTSRSLSSLIAKSSSVNSSSEASFQDSTSEELNLDMDIQSTSLSSSLDPKIQDAQKSGAVTSSRKRKTRD